MWTRLMPRSNCVVGSFGKIFATYMCGVDIISQQQNEVQSQNQRNLIIGFQCKLQLCEHAIVDRYKCILYIHLYKPQSKCVFEMQFSWSEYFCHTFSFIYGKHSKYILIHLKTEKKKKGFKNFPKRFEVEIHINIHIKFYQMNCEWNHKTKIFCHVTTASNNVRYVYFV